MSFIPNVERPAPEIGAGWSLSSAGGSLNTAARRFTIDTSIRTQVRQIRTVTTTSLIPGILESKIGTRVVSMNVIPFMRSRSVGLSAQGLSATTEVFGFFSGVPVTPFIQTNNEYSMNTATLSGAFGGAGFGVEEPEIVQFKNGGSTLVGEAKLLAIREGKMLIVDAVPKGASVSFNPDPATTVVGLESGASVVLDGTPHVHRSGLSQAANTTTITLEASASSDSSLFGTDSTATPFKTTIYVVDGPAAGEKALLTGYNGSTKVANVTPSFSVSPGVNARYRIGDLITNEFGDFFGTFVIPSSPALRFSTGSSVFRLTTSEINSAARARAATQALYNATGTMETTSDVYESTRVLIPVAGTPQQPESRVITETTRRDEFIVQGGGTKHKMLAALDSTIVIGNNVTATWSAGFSTDPGWPNAVPNIRLVGGDIVGAQAVSTVNTTSGKIESITVTKPGLALVREGSIPTPPTIQFIGNTVQTHSDNIFATAAVTIDPAAIAIMYPDDLAFDQAADEFELAASQGGWVDPIAQTFIINRRTEPNGVFLYGVDVFFKSKPTTRLGQGARKGKLPVTMQIRPVVNGYPSSGSALPFANARLRPTQISVSNNATVATTFVFRAPVYLISGQEYAFVLLSNSNEYEVFLADTNEFELDANGVPDLKRPISGNKPYGGSFFKSQNGTTWSADQDKDLMFRIRRCAFDVSTGFATFKSKDLPAANTQFDLFALNTSNLLPPKTTLSFEYKGTRNSNGVLDANFTAFDSLKDTSPNYRLQLSGGSDHTFVVNTIFNTSDTSGKISPVVDLSRLAMTGVEHNINNGEILESGFTIVSPGSGYSNTSVYTLSGPDIGSNAASITINTDNVGAITSLTVGAPGSGYTTTPTTVSIAGTGAGAVISYNGETDSHGGNADARYVTRIVTLADGFDASDIKLYLTAYKPAGTEILVYYKVLAGEDFSNFDDKKYMQMNQETSSSVVSLNESDFREYAFGSNGNSIQYDDGTGGVYDKFKSFAIKIVMLSDNSVVVPIVEDLRAIALDL